MPPRHGKSERVSRFFPAWYLGNFPDRRVILASYGARLAETWGRKVRDVLEEVGAPLFGIAVRRDSRAADAWNLLGRDGGMLTAGVGGPVTGHGASVFVVDDPIKNAEEAYSAAYRDRVHDWFSQVVETRLEPAAAIILLMTRWHRDDLAGRVVDGISGWTVLSLPALSEGDGDPLGRAEGAALWPERYPVAALEEKRRMLGPAPFAALYQQRPVPREGGFFRAEWLRFAEVVGSTWRAAGSTEGPRPLPTLRFATVDLAASLRETADYTCVAVVGVDPDGRRVLLDLVRRRLEAPAILPLLEELRARWSLPALWIERAGFQLALVQEARRRGLPVRELVPRGDKAARALPLAAALEGGRFLFAAGTPWWRDLEDELLSFPAGAHDDQVDALAYAELVAQETRQVCAPLLPGYAPPAAPTGWQVARPR